MQKLMKGFVFFLALLVILVQPFHLPAEEQQLVVGAGPSTPVVTLFFSLFETLPQAKGAVFVVPQRSVKHAGGIQATETYLFGRTGRPLNHEERSQGLEEIPLAGIPVTFASGAATGINQLSMAQLEAVMSGKIGNWREVGGSDGVIQIVGREPTEVVFALLRQSYPFMASPPFAITFERDHQVVNFLASPQGEHALVFGAAGNFPKERIIAIQGFNPDLKVGLAYARRNRDHPLVKVAQEFARSPLWHKAIREAGYLPID